MKNTTLCYLEHGGCYLMLHRTKKEQDENAGKWVGVGGKLEPGESPDACLVREVKEETGFTLHGWRFRGVVSFLSDIYEAEQMFLFTSEDFSGVLHECDEGELACILSWAPMAISWQMKSAAPAKKRDMSSWFQTQPTRYSLFYRMRYLRAGRIRSATPISAGWMKTTAPSVCAQAGQPVRNR